MTISWLLPNRIFNQNGLLLVNYWRLFAQFIKLIVLIRFETVCFGSKFYVNFCFRSCDF